MLTGSESVFVGKGKPGEMVAAGNGLSTPCGPTAGSAAAMAAAKGGDCDAFLAVLDAHDRVLRGLAYRMLGDRDQMDDVMQEVALKAFRALPRFRGEASLATWLYRITYTSCLNRLRSAGSTVPLADPDDDPGQLENARFQGGLVSSGDTADLVIRRIELSAALVSLSPEQRAVVVLVLEEGLDHRAAGEALGIPMGTVASRLAAARSALRRFLSEPSPIGETR